MTEALPQDDNGSDDGVDDEICACLNSTEPKVFLCRCGLWQNDYW